MARIATNELDPQKLSATQRLENYIDQGVSVERGFHFLKNPLIFADSLFLKKPERIMALMIMGKVLLIYTLAKRKLSLILGQRNEFIPDQKGKPTQPPTVRWVYQIFEGLDVLSIWENNQQSVRKILNLQPIHQQIICLLGAEVQACYLINCQT